MSSTDSGQCVRDALCVNCLLMFDMKQVYDRDLTTDDFMGSTSVTLCDLEFDKWVQNVLEAAWIFMGPVQILMFDRSEADDNVLCCIFQRAPLLLLLLLLKNCGHYMYWSGWFAVGHLTHQCSLVDTLCNGDTPHDFITHIFGISLQTFLVPYRLIISHVQLFESRSY